MGTNIQNQTMNQINSSIGEPFQPFVPENPRRCWSLALYAAAHTIAADLRATVNASCREFGK